MTSVTLRGRTGASSRFRQRRCGCVRGETQSDSDDHDPRVGYGGDVRKRVVKASLCVERDVHLLQLEQIEQRADSRGDWIDVRIAGAAGQSRERVEQRGR